MMQKKKSSKWSLGIGRSVDYVAKFKDAMKKYRYPVNVKYERLKEEHFDTVKSLQDSFKHVSREASVEDFVMCMDILMDKWMELFDVHQKFIIEAEKNKRPSDYEDVRSIINAKSKKKSKTCLHKQVESSNLLRVVLLVSKCAGMIDLNAKDSSGETPLMTSLRIMPKRYKNKKPSWSDPESVLIYRFLNKMSSLNQTEESMIDFNSCIYLYAREALSRENFGSKICDVARKSSSGDSFRRSCSFLARNMFDLCPFAHMIDVKAQSGDFKGRTALEVALERPPDDDTNHSREVIVTWLLIHGSSPKHVSDMTLRKEAEKKLRDLWSAGAFREKDTLSLEAKKKMSLDGNSVKQATRRASTMLIPVSSPPSTQTENPVIPRRSIMLVRADLGLDDDDDDDDGQRVGGGGGVDDVPLSDLSSPIKDDEEEKNQKEEIEMKLPLLESRGHNLPPGITIDHEAPPGIDVTTTTTTEGSTLESLIYDRVQDSQTRDEMIAALRTLERKNRDLVQDLKRDRDEVRSQLLSITKRDRENMLRTLDEFDMIDEEDESDTPIWKRIVKLSSEYVKITRCNNRATDTASEDKRGRISAYFKTLQKKLARLEGERFRAKRVYALQVSRQLS